MLDVRQAEQLVFGAGASIPDLEQRIEQQENFISILVGKNPESIVRGQEARRPATSTGGSSGTSVVPARTPPGHPPGGATADRSERADRRRQGRLFPANLVDRRRADFKAPLSPGCSQAPQGSGPSAPARCNRSSKGAEFGTASGLPKPALKRLTLVYQRTVQQAFRDVSDALVGYRKSQEVRIQQQQLTNAAEDATRLSNMRYRGGAASYLEVLDSETRFFAAQLALAQARAPRAPVIGPDLSLARRWMAAVSGPISVEICHRWPGR